MKKNILVFILCLSIPVFSQSNNGFIVEYNDLITVNYQVYDPPLRINKVEKDNLIDYSKIEGLLQSYLSANNINWAKNEYLNKSQIIIRDQEHFDAVKKSSINDYIQLETIYNFHYNNRNFAFVKYSLIFEKLPFAWTSLMVLENQNNRWYISDLINQNQILLLLGNSSNNFIIDCFSQKINNSDIKHIVDKALINKKISVGKLSLEIDSFDERLKTMFFDERIINDSANFRNASISVLPKNYKYEIYHPFLIKLFEIYEYKNEDGVKKDEDGTSRYVGKPESILLSDEPLDFLYRIFIDYGDKKFHIIKYRKNNKLLISTIEEKNDNYDIVDDILLNKLSNILLNYKLSFIKKSIEEPKKDYMGNSGGINIDEMISFIEKNKKELEKYLEK